MKCENCGKNEVTFVYRSNVNGKVTEGHLCSECAEKLGYTQRLAAQHQRMMDSFFGDSSLFGGFLGGDFFAPARQLLGGGDSLFGEGLFDDFFDQMPALTAAPREKSEQEAAPEAERKDALVDQAEQSRFARLRQLNALRLEQKKAIHQEKFERAAELRDQIRALENGQSA